MKRLPSVVVSNIAPHDLRTQAFRNEIQVKIERNDPIHIAPTSFQITVTDTPDLQDSTLAMNHNPDKSDNL